MTGMQRPGDVYRAGLAAGLLKYLSCQDCHTAQTLYRYACRRCGSTRLTWAESSGRGEVLALTVIQRAPSDAFRGLVPYTLLLVTLAEGARVMGHGEAGLAIGDAVVACFQTIDGKPLLAFRRVAGS